MLRAWINIDKGERKTVKKIISLILAAAMLLSVCIFANAEQSVELRFSDDGDFTILQISDPQDDQYPAYDMLRLIELSIAQSDPDLIVFTGDIVEDSRIGDFNIDGENGREGVRIEDISGNLDYETTLKNVRATCDAVFEAAEKAGIPFAVTQGNNDYRSGISNEDWLKIYGEYEHCLVKDESPDEEGRIDYNLEIKGSDGNAAFNLWMMDTRSSTVKEDQIEWYKQECAALTEANGGNPVPAMVFQHINVAEIGNLFEPCRFWDEGARNVGTKFYRLNKDIANGVNSGAVEPGQTSEQFTAWKECGDVIGAFFGHWHSEGYSGVYDGIELGMTYGCEFAKPGPYGVRVITLHEDDILNYDNDLFVYTGSVTKGTEKLEKQIDEPYKEPANIFEKIGAFFVNSAVNLYNMILKLFV